MRERTSGFSLMELLIASAVMVIVLLLTTTFFGQQARMSERTQALSDLQSRLRITMHILTTDMVLSGAGEYVAADGTTKKPSSSAPAPTYPFNKCFIEGSDIHVPCLDLDNGGGSNFGMSSTYVNNLRPVDESCREVGYERTSEDELIRLEQLCGDFAEVIDRSADDWPPEEVMARGIVATNAVLRCSNGDSVTVFPNSTDCPDDSSYPRSAVVSLVARTLTTFDAPSDTFTLPDGSWITCPDGYRCKQLTQEVTLPNLKE